MNSNREKIIDQVLKARIIVIVRGVFGEDCLSLAKALYAGGIELMEVTFDQSSEENRRRTTETIGLLNRELGDKMAIGAGTVTTTAMAKAAAEAGAKFIVSPNTDADVIRTTVECGMVSMPGAMTPTEIMAAHNAGADFVKVFPVTSLGAAYIKAVRAPLNHIRLLAVGGVNEKNAADFIAAGALGVGVGGNLVNREWIKNGEFGKITELAEKYVSGIAHPGKPEELKEGRCSI